MITNKPRLDARGVVFQAELDSARACDACAAAEFDDRQES